ncbi:MAG: excinuclease ABC subunit UvrC [Methylococcaceae bacterium]|nr:excinuclease ABC subunit UvrC [Methylococcaceae bacterium]
MTPNQTALLFDAQAFLKNLTHRPGVYKMLDALGEIIYVGKAKDLKNRVASYFRNPNTTSKQRAMVSRIAAINITITHTEGEALILESQQIKHHKPRYNICLRDDKSYPYIYISTTHAFPQITIHRGTKKKPGKYYGPYPSANAVRESLKLLQKMFLIRQCDDTFYKHRSRPCLQHQIGRCKAPCVGMVDQVSYAQDLLDTQLFLEGKGNQLIAQRIAKMEQASTALEFEQAASYRDQIVRLRSIMEKYFVPGEQGDIDILACATQTGIACVQVFFIRHGQSLGSKSFFPKINDSYSPEDILQAFIAQYYLEKQLPYELIVSHLPPETELLCEVLTKQAQHSVTISPNVRGERQKWLQMAQTNAENCLSQKISDKHSVAERLSSLQSLLNLKSLPERMECFDISHTQGDQTVASCVVFNQEGPLKSAYRRFNITGITAGDDYAAMQQAISRRFKRLQQGEHLLPDLLFIDGGKGQVGAAQKALTELGINNVMIVGVSKGADRKAGMEKIILVDREQPLDIKPGMSGLLLIQHIRDEAHRFAITGHRQRRGKAKQQSVLEGIVGLGPKRRQSLLKQFGGLQGIARASVDALCSINGISKPLAQRIYELFHRQDGA